MKRKRKLTSHTRCENIIKLFVRLGNIPAILGVFFWSHLPSYARYCIIVKKLRLEKDPGSKPKIIFQLHTAQTIICGKKINRMSSYTFGRDTFIHKKIYGKNEVHSGTPNSES